MKRSLTLITALLLAPPSGVYAADLPLQKPAIITAPGAEFQDEARPGAMIIGMDRT